HSAQATGQLGRRASGSAGSQLLKIPYQKDVSSDEIVNADEGSKVSFIDSFPKAYAKPDSRNSANPS
ncbi:hypothetical protein, partial [Almyronema epifaneia]